MSLRINILPSYAMPPKNLLKIGLLLLLVSWSVKQCTVSLAASNLGGSLKAQAVSADQKAEIADETEEYQIKIAEEQVKDDPDRGDIEEWQEKISDKRKDIRKEYSVKSVEADLDAAQDSADAMMWFRWFLKLKFWLDLFKIAGVVLVLWAGMQLMSDEETPPAMKWFSVGVAIIALFSILVGGLFSFVS